MAELILADLPYVQIADPKKLTTSGYDLIEHLLSKSVSKTKCFRRTNIFKY